MFIPEPKRKTIEEIKLSFSNRGYKAIIDNYKNNSDRINYICPNGHFGSIIYGNFQQGKGCRECKNDKLSKDRRHSLDFVQEQFLLSGYNPLFNDYINAYSKLKVQCPVGHVFHISYGSFYTGCRCKECAIQKRCGEGNHNYNPNRQEVYLNKYMHRVFTASISKLNNKDNRKLSRLAVQEILGYTYDEFINHFITHSNWHRVTQSYVWCPSSKNGWHIDHVFPIVAFVRKGILEPSIVHALDNLQPLTARENKIKKDKYNIDEFENYLLVRNIVVPAD